MKYSIRFYQGCRMLDKADEIIIPYTEKTSQLLKFAKKYKNARIVAECLGLNNDEILDSLDIFKVAAKNGEFAVMLTYHQKEVLPDLEEAMVKYFFIDQANTIDKLTGFINLGVSDVYITDELGFYLGEIAQTVHDKGVSIRVFPNVAQSSSEIPGDTFKYFYIRPEAMQQYEPYIDYIEFYGSLDRQSVLFKIYKEGQWLGSLDTLILGLKTEIPNTCIVPYFDTARLKCKKRCMMNLQCEVCKNILDLAKVLEDKDFGITVERKRLDERIKNEDKSGDSTSI